MLFWETTVRCNLACAGCGKIDYPAEILNQRLTVAQCLEAVEECGAPVVAVAGGEPLLHKEIGEIVGITPTHACRIFKRYESKGSEAIIKRQRGRRPGEQLTLKEEQAAAIQKMIIDKTPDQIVGLVWSQVEE